MEVSTQHGHLALLAADETQPVVFEGHVGHPAWSAPGLANRSKSNEIALLWRQGILSQGPAAVAINEGSKSGVRNRLRSLKPAKYQTIELKVFPADMSNHADLRCPSDERAHVHPLR